VGDRHVLEMLQKNAWNLGGESSGHIICLDANTTGDGIVSALRVLAVMISSGRSLQTLKQGMNKCPQVLINVPVDNVRQVSLDDPKLQLAVKTAEDQLKGQGRVLLRPSGTEAVVRVMVEGEDRKMITAIAEELASAVMAYR